jgi:hypothetical protein
MGRRHALLIGIDDYAFAPLSSCVNDATKLRDKLNELGLFDAAKMETTLMLSPAPPGVTVPTRRAVLSYLRALYRAPDPLDRLLVYFAGHGISARMGRGMDRLHTIIVPADVQLLADSGEDLIDLDELVARFARRGAREQFWILDACRNTPEEAGRVNPVEIGWDKPTSNDPLDAVEMAQAVLYAVAPLGEAQAVKAGHGAFTALLLQGLEGRGRAAFYQEERDTFLVDARSLVDYAADRIGRAVSPGDWRRQYMLPRIWCSETEPGPLRDLGQLANSGFQVKITPEPAAAAIEVSLSLRRRVLEAWPPRANGEAVTLLPDRYRITAQLAATDNLWLPPDPGSWLVDLRETDRLEVKVSPRPQQAVRSTTIAGPVQFPPAETPQLAGLGPFVAEILGIAAQLAAGTVSEASKTAFDALVARLPRDARRGVAAVERSPGSQARQIVIAEAVDGLAEMDREAVAKLAQALVTELRKETTPHRFNLDRLEAAQVPLGNISVDRGTGVRVDRVEVSGDVQVGNISIGLPTAARLSIAPATARASVSSTTPQALSRSPERLERLPTTTGSLGSDPIEPAQITVEARDPGAHVRLVRLSGGRVQIEGEPGRPLVVAPGVWRVEVLLLDEVIAATEEDFGPGEVCIVAAAAQITPALAALLPDPEAEARRAADRPPSELVPSESIGPMQGAILPTILPLLALKPYDKQDRVLNSFSPRLGIPPVTLPEPHSPWDGALAGAIAFDGPWNDAEVLDFVARTSITSEEPLLLNWRDKSGRILLFSERAYPQQLRSRDGEAIVTLPGGVALSVGAPRLAGFITVISVIAWPDGQIQVTTHLFEIRDSGPWLPPGPLARSVTIADRLTRAGVDIDTVAPGVFSLLEFQSDPGSAAGAPGLAALAWFSRSRLLANERSMKPERRKFLEQRQDEVISLFHYLPTTTMPDAAVIDALTSDTPDRWIDSLLQSRHFGQPVYADAVAVLARRAMATKQLDHWSVARFQRLDPNAVFNVIRLNPERS